MAFRIHLRRGAGAYICGEESAMIESIEGKRGLPRHKPPLPFQVGIFGRPSLINNVETLYWIRDLIERGPDWWLDQGRNGRRGLHTYSVSGRVANPGVKTTPAGVTVRELIDEYCGACCQATSSRPICPVALRAASCPRRWAIFPWISYAGALWRIHRLGGCGCPVGPGRHARGGAQPAALLRR